MRIQLNKCENMLKMRLFLLFKVNNVILDDDDEDDGEEFLIEEAPKDPLVSLEAGDEAAVEAGGQEHGVLVQQVKTKLVKSVKTYNNQIIDPRDPEGAAGW